LELCESKREVNDLKRTRIGGQAVIEGVMMKNGDHYAVAVRKPDHEIEVKVETYTPIGEKHKILKLPILRGIVNFFESLVIGVKTLTYSADFYEEEETKPSSKHDDKKQKDENEKKKSEKRIDRSEKLKDENEKQETSDELLMIGTVIVSLVIAVALFMLLPAFLAGLMEHVTKSRVLISIVEGAIRLFIFLAYVILISMMKDIKRVFMYHGAEHKSINCLEAGDALTPENIKKHSRYHKRCGTSFLFVVMIVSIIVFMFIDVEAMWLRLLTRVLLVPLIAGISYEFIMYAGKSDSKLAYILSVPGMWVQRLTTKEPDMEMIEVAIRSVKAVLDWKAYQEAMRLGELED
jgi:hypothetical protein